MVDVHDIDALLIGALYGELTPADEARLAAHLESHPTDRTALADLTRARTAVRDSRILTFQLEPPQAVSALLLQEAHRRAPAPRRAAVDADDGRESWFFRFVRSFAAHPAMAAAAMLVLVVGAAGVLKMRDHGDFAEKAVDTGDQLRRAPTTIAAGPTGAATAPEAQPVAPAFEDQLRQQGEQTADRGAAAAARAGSGSSTAGYTVGLAADVDGVPDPMAKQKGGESGKLTASDSTIVATKPPAHAASPAKKGMVVTTPQLALKDDDFETANGVTEGKPKARKRDEANLDGDVGGGAPGGSFGAATTQGPAAAPSPPPPPAPMPSKSPKPAPAQDAKLADRPADKAEQATPAEATRRADKSLDAWAAQQLAQVVQLAHAGKCEEAASHAATISTRAPEFYADNVASNIELKKCMAYIAEAHDKAQRAAQQKRAAEKRATDSAK